MLYGDLIYMRFITEQAWSAGSALAIILMVCVLLSMAVMRRAERAGGREAGGGGTDYGKAPSHVFQIDIRIDPAVPVRADPDPDRVLVQFEQDARPLDGVHAQLVRAAAEHLGDHGRHRGDGHAGGALLARGHGARHGRGHRPARDEEAAAHGHREPLAAADGQPGPGDGHLADAAVPGDRPAQRLCAPAHRAHHVQPAVCDLLRAAPAAPELRRAVRGGARPWLHAADGALARW